MSDRERTVYKYILARTELSHTMRLTVAALRTMRKAEVVERV